MCSAAPFKARRPPKIAVYSAWLSPAVPQSLNGATVHILNQRSIKNREPALVIGVDSIVETPLNKTLITYHVDGDKSSLWDNTLNGFASQLG